MVAQAVVIVPHIVNISPWIVAVALTCGLWRWMVFLGRWGYPQRWVKSILVVASAVGVAVSEGDMTSLETMAGLLIVGFALKLLEMHSRRDAYLVIFLCYFVIAMEFLFDQSIPVAFYQVLAAVVVTAAMVGMNQLHTRVRPIASLKLAGTLIFQAVPLMLVLFVFFPRIAPLWSVPLPGASSTGISDKVTPGSIAKLTQSDEIAFWVVFGDVVPPPSAMYWRGLVYSDFRDGTWSAGTVGKDQGVGTERFAGVESRVLFESRGRGSLTYQVLMEPTRAQFLFAMKVAVPLTYDIRLNPDYTLRSLNPIHSLLRYEVQSFPDTAIDRELPKVMRDRETRLPADDNPRAQEFARALLARTGSTQGFIDAIAKHIASEPYVYTLEPPTLPEQNSIDAFWFDTRRGFCTHYAGAFVYLARAAGIPARMVGGYQGGSYNPVTNHLVVRQYDAHAWAEVWKEDEGWRRVDPTAAVAPERIELGLRAALSAADRSALSALTNARFDGLATLAEAMYFLESMEHRWNLWVVGFDGDLQTRYLEDLIGEVTPARIGIAMVVGGGVSLGLVVLTLFWRRRPPPEHPALRVFGRFSRGVASMGLRRRMDESPGAFLRRIMAEGRADTVAVSQQLETLLYNPNAPCTSDELRELKRALRRLRLQLALRFRGGAAAGAIS
jgi:transglutaminase-like putative cysteine protease